MLHLNVVHIELDIITGAKGTISIRGIQMSNFMSTLTRSLPYYIIVKEKLLR
jgi:hypothetical protein